MTAVRIERYEQTHLEAMCRAFNAVTAEEPHIARLTPELFLELVEPKSYFDPAGILVAVRGQEVVGWVHACLAPPSEPYHEPNANFPRIRMLIFRSDDLKAGGVLVAEATAWLKQVGSGQAELEAMHCKAGYPFYRGLWMGGEPMCPTGSLPQLEVAFEVAGYKKEAESTMMVGDLSSAPPELDASVALEFVSAPAAMKHEPMRESWVGFEPMRIQAVLDGVEVGSIGWVLLPHVASKLGSPAVNIWSLGVQEEHWRKGIAAALVSRACSLGYAQGARVASVGTQLWNAPAQATYAKLGFEPYCVVSGRALKLEQAAGSDSAPGGEQ